MAVGAGDYHRWLFGTLLVMAVLTLSGFIQPWIDRCKKEIELHIPFSGEDQSIQDLEREMEASS